MARVPFATAATILPATGSLEDARTRHQRLMIEAFGGQRPVFAGTVIRGLGAHLELRLEDASPQLGTPAGAGLVLCAWDDPATAESGLARLARPAQEVGLTTTPLHGITLAGAFYNPTITRFNPEEAFTAIMYVPPTENVDTLTFYTDVAELVTPPGALNPASGIHFGFTLNGGLYVIGVFESERAWREEFARVEAAIREVVRDYTAEPQVIPVRGQVVAGEGGFEEINYVHGRVQN